MKKTNHFLTQSKLHTLGAACTKLFPRLLATVAVIVTLTACNGNRNRNTLDDAAYMEVADSTGIMDVYAYEGNIKAHGKNPAAHYMVVISEELDSVNGTYTMTTTYIVADTVKNHPHKSRGKKMTHWGIPGHHNAKVYTLAPDSGSTDSVYLYVESDTTVVLLDKNKMKPEHPDHYRLHKTQHHRHHIKK